MIFWRGAYLSYSTEVAKDTINTKMFYAQWDTAAATFCMSKYHLIILLLVFRKFQPFL